MTIYFAPIARLLGDLVVSLPPLQSLIEESKEDLCLIMRSPAQRGLDKRIPGLASAISEPEFLRHRQNDPELKLINLRAHPLQTDYVWGSQEFKTRFPNYRISDVIAQICRDLQIEDGQRELKPLVAREHSELKNTVILVPGTASPIKQWPSRNWLSLKQKLEALGIPVLVLGEPRYNSQVASLLQSGMPWIPTPFLYDALDLISSARAVVAVDTGLMHLAVHQGIKTVALFREYTMFLRDYENVRNVFAPDCSPLCREREFCFSPNATEFFPDWSNDAALSHWSNLKCQERRSCMSFINVDLVLASLFQLW